MLGLPSRTPSPKGLQRITEIFNTNSRALKSARRIPNMRIIHDKISKCESAESALEYVSTVENAPQLLSIVCLRALLKKFRTPSTEIARNYSKYSDLIQQTVETVNRINFKEHPLPSVLCILESLFSLHRYYGTDVGLGLNQIFHVISAKMSSSSQEEFKQMTNLLNSKTIESLKDFNIPSLLMSNLIRRLASRHFDARAYLDPIVTVIGFAEQIGYKSSNLQSIWTPIQDWIISNQAELTQSDYVKIFMIMSYIPSTSVESNQIVAAGIQSMNFRRMSPNDLSMLFFALCNLKDSDFGITDRKLQIYRAFEAVLPALSVERYIQCLEALVVSQTGDKELKQAFLDEAHFKLDSGEVNVRQFSILLGAMMNFNIKEYALLVAMEKVLDEFLKSPLVYATSAKDFALLCNQLGDFTSSDGEVRSTFDRHWADLQKLFMGRQSEFSTKQSIDIFYNISKFHESDRLSGSFTKSLRTLDSVSQESALRFIVTSSYCKKVHKVMLETASKRFLSLSSRTECIQISSKLLSEFVQMYSQIGNFAMKENVLQKVLELLNAENSTEPKLIDAITSLSALDALDAS